MMGREVSSRMDGCIEWYELNWPSSSLKEFIHWLYCILLDLYKLGLWYRQMDRLMKIPDMIPKRGSFTTSVGELH